MNSMKGKLNIFQRTVLIWNGMHSYNAVHVARIPQHLDVVRLKDIINRHIEYYGLAGHVIDHRKKKFHYYGGSANIEVKVIEGQEDALATLCSEIQEQLNMPFTGNTKINPFRFFVVREDDSFYLGLVYFHIIAGADSMVSFLKSIVKSYMNEKTSGPYLSLNLYPRSYRYLLPINLKNIFGWIFTMLGYIANLRKSFRPGYSDLNNHSIGFSYFCIEPPQFHSLSRTAKRWGVTLNDMFLAILLKSLSPLASKRKYASRRKKISLASIVNIRRDLSVDNPEIFGIFLGYFSVSHTVPDGIQLEQLVKDIHRQTEKIKNYKLYLRTIIEMGVTLVLISLFFQKRQKKFYSKYYPLWGGITNINLNALWEESGDKISIDYFRAVSTGPATPLIFSFTTVNDVLNIAVSFRTTVFSKTDVEKIISNFSNYISNLDRGQE